MKYKYHEEKGYSGLIYEYFNCGKCECLLTNYEESLPNFCPNCGEKIDKEPIK